MKSESANTSTGRCDSSASVGTPEIVKVNLSGSPVDNFASLVTIGISMWKQAGELLVRMMDSDPSFRDKIKRLHPSISDDMLNVFERIGRRQLFPQLLANNSVGARALAFMPYDVQEKHASKPIQVVICNSKRRIVVEKRIEELTQRQCEQVFSGDRILSPQEQEKEINNRMNSSGVTANKSVPVITEASVKKKPSVTRLGCYSVTIDRAGVITFKPAKESWKAQQIKVDRPPGSAGSFSGEVIFFTT